MRENRFGTTHKNPNSSTSKFEIQRRRGFTEILKAYSAQTTYSGIYDDDLEKIRRTKFRTCY